MYLLPSDNWLRETMFHTYECGSWYSSVFKEGETSEWCLSINKKGKIQHVEIGGRDSWVMYGPAFFTAAWSEAFFPILEAYYHLPGTEQFHWEQVYMEIVNGTAQKRLADAKLIGTQDSLLSHLPKFAEQTDLYINRQPSTQVYEFENLEELRLFDAKYQNHSNNQAMELISSVFQVDESEIQDIRCLKAGMTNKSFLFQVAGKHYICRIPGPGTDQLINRRQEGEVFEAVKPLHITEHVVYFNRETGYKIAEYYEGARNANAENWEDMKRCMELLRSLHSSGLQLNHSFLIRERIKFYESLCYRHGQIPFEDYSEVRQWMFALMNHLDSLDRPQTISHIDSCVDNFLFLPDGSLKLIDWEYCGMCDSLIDVAMCAIYSYYNEEQIDHLIELYLQRQPAKEERLVVYSYVALGGFLWSLWAVYKSALGEEFGEYTIIMYRYAKRYYHKSRTL